MEEAIKFAREIIRKREAASKTKSPKLRHDYNLSISRSMNDLLYYVQMHHYDMNEIWRKAFNEASE